MKKITYTLAIDFDGTIVEHKFPLIGNPTPYAFETLKALQNEGHKLILYTMRSHKSTSIKEAFFDTESGEMKIKKKEIDALNEAVAFCEEKGIKFYGINTNPSQIFWTSSPKTYADIFIDDAALGCPLISKGNERPFVDWLKVRELLKEEYDISPNYKD